MQDLVEQSLEEKASEIEGEYRKHKRRRRKIKEKKDRNSGDERQRPTCDKGNEQKDYYNNKGLRKEKREFNKHLLFPHLYPLFKILFPIMVAAFFFLITVIIKQEKEKNSYGVPHASKRC
ncbi:hypothetical protein, unlikely [Trypanosoma congolense IL3000]|uniref:Uncharacterized protein n=1 Tax=Trypanosoma congolense (strain IL3000) TaxID=1068625 RepID=F9WHR9_TRYCI|nr:hypothetical protein, unlikely [Trypanosoma congolense IL3000]